MGSKGCLAEEWRCSRTPLCADRWEVNRGESTRCEGEVRSSHAPVQTLRRHILQERAHFLHKLACHFHAVTRGALQHEDQDLQRQHLQHGATGRGMSAANDSLA